MSIDLLRRRAARAGRPAPAALLALLLSAGCGGGPTYSVSPDRGEIAFEAVAGAPSAPPTQYLTVRYQGDGLLLGYPADQAVPDWLVWSVVEEAPGLVRLRIDVAAPVVPAERRTTLRFVTGKADGSAYVVKDLPVRYVVRRGLRVAEAALAFSSVEGTAPARQALTLSSDLAQEGWALEVESPSGEPTDWLVLPAATGSFQGGSGAAQVGVAAFPGGSYAAVLVVRDAVQVVRARIPVSYQVAGPYTVEGPQAAAITEASAVAALDRPLRIRTNLGAAEGAGHRWTITSDQPWAAVTPASGDLSADVPLVVHLDPDGLWALPDGRSRANLTLQFSSGGAMTRRIQLAVDLSLAPALTAPAAVTIPARGALAPADLARSVTVGSNLGTAFASRGGWVASASSPWLAPAPAAGAAPGAVVSLSLVPAALAGLADGSHAAAVTFQPTDPRVAAASTAVTLDFHPATVTGVTPHAAFVGQGGEVLLRGTGFGAGPTIPVTFGGQVLTGRVVDDTRVRLTAPAPAAAGPITASVANGLGLARGGAQQVAVPVPACPALREELPASSFFANITTDPERQAVLLTGSRSDGLRRYRCADGAWVQDGATLALGRSVAVSADGQDLLLVAAEMFQPLTVQRLDPVTLAARDTLTRPSVARGDLIGAFNDGRLLVVSTEQWASGVWYPGLDTYANVDAYAPSGAMTRDRDRMLLAGTLGGAQLLSFEAGAAAATAHPVAALPSSWMRWAVSGDGGRLVVDGAVYDRDFRALGEISFARWPEAVAVSPDGRFAYGLLEMPGTTRWALARADISGAAGPYPTEWLGPPIPIPLTEHPMAVAVSEDGRTLLVLTAGREVFSAFFYAEPLP